MSTAAAKRTAPLAAAPPPAEEPELTEAQQAEKERRELDAATITLEWNGQVVGTIPKRRGRWPSKAGRLFEEDKYVGALQSLLGEEAYLRLEDLCPVIDDLNEFANHAGDVIQRECVP